MIKLFNSYMPELPELEKILHSGNISYNKYGEIFERGLRAYLKNDYILTTSNFFYAINVVLSTLGLQPGDEVIISPLNCLASIMPYKNYGLKIVFADIDINTGTISPDCIKKKINSKTKLIVSSHFCGYMGFVEEIRKIASDNSVFLINDCFEAFETVPNEIKMKSLNCETYIYHFGPTKLPNTIDGGAIEFFDKKLYEKAICIRDLGIDRNTFRDSIGEIKKDIDIAYNSYGAMMTEVNSYIGVEQLNNLKEIKKINKKNFDYLLANLDYYIVYNTTMLTNSNHSNNWVFGFLSANKAEEMNNLRINHNLYASGVHTVINRYSIFGSNETFKIAEDFTSKFIAIPCGWWANYGND